MPEFDNNKLEIYKGIIHYFLTHTSFSLENIAELTDTSIKTISSIYSSKNFALHLSAELKLLKLYQAALQWNTDKPTDNANYKKINEEVRL